MVFFAPGSQGTAAIVNVIDEARSSVKVQAYRLTLPAVAKALKAAHERGVDVRVVLDGAQQSDKYSDATYFHNAGIAVRIDPKHPIAHNKVIIADDAVLVTGSFNFSPSAEKNAENVLVVRAAPEVLAAYVANFDAHLKHSDVYRAPGAGSDRPDEGKPKGKIILRGAAERR